MTLNDTVRASLELTWYPSRDMHTIIERYPQANWDKVNEILSNFKKLNINCSKEALE